MALLALMLLSGCGEVSPLGSRPKSDRFLSLAVIEPFWTTTSITYFQVQGSWFDADGKVSQGRLWNGHNGPHGGNPQAPYGVPDQQQTLLWLKKNTTATANQGGRWSPGRPAGCWFAQLLALGSRPVPGSGQ